MHTFTQYPLWTRILAFVLIIVFFVTFIRTSRAQNTHVPETQARVENTSFTPQKSATFGFAVSGVIEAKDAITVRAQTAGIVHSDLKEEGMYVELGEVLLIQKVPVLDSKIALQQETGTLNELVQNGVVVQSVNTMKSSGISYDGATTSVSITKNSTDSQIEDTTKHLATQLQGSVLGLVSALNFIDSNREYFSQKSLRAYTETISTLYGTQPSFLSNGVLYQVTSHDDLLDDFESLKEVEEIDTAELLRISMRIDTVFDTVSSMFSNAENKFFDEREVDENSSLYAAYLDHRESLVRSASGLETVINTLRTIQNIGTQNIHDQTTQALIQEVQYRNAEELSQNALKVEYQSDLVSNAQLGVLYAEEALGMPRAPFSGMVDEVFVNSGEYVLPGAPLMTLVGEGAQELKVSVPQAMKTYLKEGLVFIVDKEIVGYVDRFSPVLSNGSVTVYIELIDTTYTVGEVLRGELLFELTDDVVLIPRPYLHFDAVGAFVQTETGAVVRVVILHDTGKMFVVKPVTNISEALRKTSGISF